MENKERTLKPVNQKTVYHSAAILFDKIMNDEIPVEKAEQACNALNVMNRTYALEIKRAEFEKSVSLRTIELVNFEAEEQKQIS